MAFNKDTIFPLLKQYIFWIADPAWTLTGFPGGPGSPGGPGGPKIPLKGTAKRSIKRVLVDLLIRFV